MAGHVWSYGQLGAAVAQLAARLPQSAPGESQPVTAVMVQREASAFIGILAAHLCGHAFVPLNVAHPAARSARVLELSGAGRVICGDLAADRLDSILAHLSKSPARPEIIACGERPVDYADATSDVLPRLPEVEPEALAYILFTSGSTGTPKGVAVSWANLAAYLDATETVFPARPGDRHSQTFDLNFDLAIHDVLVAFSRGATLVVPSDRDFNRIGDWLREAAITCWFSVPTLGFQMRMQGALEPGAFTSLRSVLFCGEPLPAHLAAEWRAAAPNASVENWYGPTEATIACARFVLGEAPVGGETVPIGRAFPGSGLRVLDTTRRPLPSGHAGDLYITGRQLAQGYLNDPGRTRAAFVTLDDGTRAYRTGDRALMRADGHVVFLGREDSQIKLRGHRIELGEVEAALRRATDGAHVAVLPWPGGGAGTRALIGAVEGPYDTDRVMERLVADLPDYMRPAEVVARPAFPRNASGKLDRKALAAEIAADQALPEGEVPEDPVAAALLDAVRTAAPAISPARAMSADSLLEGGMDSLAFIAFTILLEDRFGLKLDQDGVVRLAEMSFADIVQLLRRHARGTGPGACLGAWMRTLVARFSLLVRKPRVRLIRTNQFAERFPRLLDRADAHLVVAVGSSGVFRSFDPQAFERAWPRPDGPILAVNAGLPAVSPKGLALVARFIRDECRVRGMRLRLCLWELDPLHISTDPPAGDVNLAPSDLRPGTRRTLPQVASEFDWSLEARGAWLADPDQPVERRRPNWARARDRGVADAFNGALTIDRARLDDWIHGARMLADISDRLLVYIHPPDPAMIAEAAPPEGPDRLAELLDEITDGLGIEVLDWRDFDLGPADFMDINHVNAVRGRARLSAQLAIRAAARIAAKGEGA
ncbi:amino acid adenylation domain-containing protein [Rhodovulum steppense]|uniref:amino acid adenylation domain-containing protein n=1 Tax=Rhodovulum steppense TaxID=540251 RepID=UPI0014047085|nr:amino acid adenylation domain-containing protein [Rhodovulum steppense]